MKHKRIRGLVPAMASAVPGSDSVPELLAELTQGVSDFKARHSAQLDEVTQMVESQQATIDSLRAGGGGVSASIIHPAGGLRQGGRSVMPIDAETLEGFHAQMMGRPNAGMTTQSNPDGGYTVAPEIDQQIDAFVRDSSVMRSLARVVALPDGMGHWEKILGRSGAQSAWAGEEDDRNDTATGVLGKVELHPHELYAIPMLTNHLLEDSGFDIQAFVEEDVAGEFALTEGAAFISGDGVKKPRGFLTFDATTEADADRPFGKLQYVATGQSGAFASSNPADKLMDLVTALRRPYRQGDGVAWLMNSTTANVVRKFKDGQGNYLWTASITAGQPDRLGGYPVAIDESMPDIGADEFAVAFGNWRKGYAIIDKPGLVLIVDRVTKKGWTKLYFARRVGGGLVDSNAIKLLKFSGS